MTQLYDWGGPTNQPDAVTNAKLKQDQAHFTERIDVEAALSRQFAQRNAATAGLVWGYYGGNAFGYTVPDGTFILSANATNYLEVSSSGVVVKNTAGWTTGYRHVAKIITDGGSITSFEDVREAGGGGTGGTYSVGAGLTLAENIFSVADNGITDAKIGNRTVNQSAAAASNTGSLTTLLSGIVTAIKGILGGSLNWYGAAPITLTDTRAHVENTAPHTGHFDVDGSKALSGNLDAGGNGLTNVALPVNASDAVTKEYADALANGVSIKASVRAATTGNVTLAGLQTIDGVALANGDRVLVWKQANAIQNGIYTAAAGSWSRAEDADEDTEMPPGTATFVEFGFAPNGNGGKRFTMITSDIEVGVDSQQWTIDSAFSGGEANTSSNTGTGVGLAKTKEGANLPFKSLKAGSPKVALTSNVDDVTVNIVEGELNLGSMSGSAPMADAVPWAGIADKPASFQPSAHAASHEHGGSDSLGAYPAGANQLVRTGAAGQIHPSNLPSLGGGVPLSTVNAKGDLVVATGNAAVTRLPVGANGKVLKANSATVSGLEWTDDTSLALASEAEAEAGADNSKAMTPLRTAQAIEAQRPTTTDIGATHTTESLADDASELTKLDVPGLIMLTRIEVDADAWVRFYGSETAAIDDAEREVDDDSPVGSGLMAEFILTAATTLVIENLSPPIWCKAKKGEGADTGVWVRVTNISGGATAITLDFDYMAVNPVMVSE